MKQSLIFLLLICGVAALAASAKPSAIPVAPFIAVAPGVTAEIVLQYDAAAKTGTDWEKARTLAWYWGNTPANTVKNAVNYLRDGIQRMTGKELPVVNRSDLSRGIILTTLAGAPTVLQKDQEVLNALRDTGEDAYNANEAYFIRSETKRLLIIANTEQGLAAAVVDLLDSVNYEILGMGPDWVYAPDYRQKPLVFTLAHAGRPSFYTRRLWPTSGQDHGVGTLMSDTLTDPADELVEKSFYRWMVGLRVFGSSMPNFPGHSLQTFHRDVIAAMRAQHVTDGFLVPKCTIAPAADRPAASLQNAGQMWINDDRDGTPQAGKLFISTGKEWSEENPSLVNANLDLSVPLVRNVVLERMKRYAELSFTQNPNDLFVFGYEPEDGSGYADLEKLLKDKTWYPDYLAKEGTPLGQPYVLHGFLGLDQPKEMWDPASPSDTVFGFANWLLREYDKWIASLPAAERVTSTGKKKQELVRCSGYSYNYHDVPPNFNLDPRIRVMIASFPKHRGTGKWKRYVSHIDLAQAFKRLLPREPSGDYLILSQAYFGDYDSSGIPPQWSNAAKAIIDDYQPLFDGGMKAINVEIDFNFARLGLGYYLLAQYLWDVKQTPAQLDARRDRWFQRAFGSGWREMKAYFNFMQPEHYPVNAPNAWARAIRYIEAADAKIDAVSEPAAQKRLDDLKQFWYFHYLCCTGKTTAREMREFAWKGQTAYMIPEYVVTRRFFNTISAAEAAGLEFTNGPAHYTQAETQACWTKVLDYWKWTSVTLFANAVLIDGTKGKDVDLNDLVPVKEFQCAIPDERYRYFSGYMKTPKFLQIARKPGDEIGFKLIWPYSPNEVYYRQVDLDYGVDIWNSTKKAWDSFIDKSKTVQPSQQVELAGKPYQLVEVRFKAPRRGTYRFDIGHGGNDSPLSSLDFDIQADKYTGNALHGFTMNNTPDSVTQSPVYIYLPKGTKTLDLEVWDAFGSKTVTFYKGLPAKGLSKLRTEDISAMGTHTVALQPGEDGTVAMIAGNGFAFPYLYSVPLLWAKSPCVLLVPRGIAKADGLTPIE